MYSQAQDTATRPSHAAEASTDPRHEPVRSRWTPKPEQTLFLESIFNSGMVNPSKNETVRIRKMLEKFGSVGDTNVFYWFQNRRSRSRRRQRQIQESLATGEPQRGIQNEKRAVAAGGFAPNSFCINTGSCSLVDSGSSSSGGISTDHYFFSYPGLQELGSQNSIFGHSDATNSQYQSGVITVFVNGVATDVSRGPFDIKEMFGGDFVLFHSSGMPLQVNEYGFLVHSLQHGESYFLVPRNS
ncbi:LOW QUALITY PROTEIN: WUSCHEL-related homeobox 11-like [Primulina tabacum]|uniref:LOW QUALITY PROTEIN: WUSCHEL-related homeobox 11-like n=1 Tax=Primulina tabacum TaxID=48773 RepID=UPI003F5A6AAD